MSFSSVVDVGLTCCSSYLTTSAAPLISPSGKCFRFYSVSRDFIFVVVLLAYAVCSEFPRYFSKIICLSNIPSNVLLFAPISFHKANESSVISWHVHSDSFQSFTM